MKFPTTSTAIFVLSLAAVAAVHAQNNVFTNSGVGNDWSTVDNWNAEGIAGVGDTVQLNATTMNVDANYTVATFQNSFGTADSVVSSSGGGVLTIDPLGNNNVAITNVTGNAGSNLQFTGNVTIDNTATNTAISLITFGNSTSNVITFATGSTLNITSPIEIVSSSGRTVNFNGTLTGGNPVESLGTAGIRIAANTTGVTFGATADNTGFDGDIVFFANSSVVSESTVAGGFVNTGHKIQINGSGTSLTLNGAGGMQGNVVIGAGNSFGLIANANQESMGFLNLGNGSSFGLTIGSAVTELAFSDSSAFDWETGTVSITGFKENTIRFGTDENGLTATQLSQIDGGIYSLTSGGYLTVPEPGAFALIFGACAIGFAVGRRRRS